MPASGVVWGVVHDGSHLYPGVHAALEKMRAAGKKIIMLSNAPRRAQKVAKPVKAAKKAKAPARKAAGVATMSEVAAS